MYGFHPAPAEIRYRRRTSGGCVLQGHSVSPFKEGHGRRHPDNEHGKFEKVKGPYRLICTYTVKSTLLGEDAEQTFVTYIRREGGAYVFDPEIEAWLD